MRRFLYALLGTVAGLGGLIGLKANLAPSEAVADTAAAPPPAVADTAAEPSAPAGDPKAGTPKAGNPKAGDPEAGDARAPAATKTGTGKLVQNQYESIQVKVTVSGTKISKVEIAALNPKDKKSEQIASGALPKLQQATLAANSADVDTVSGATYTTKSYQESLQSALDQAGL